MIEKWQRITRSARMREQMEGSSDPFKRCLTQFLARIGLLRRDSDFVGEIHPTSLDTVSVGAGVQ